jgi:hypothetical protein
MFYWTTSSGILISTTWNPSSGTIKVHTFNLLCWQFRVNEFIAFVTVFRQLLVIRVTFEFTSIISELIGLYNLRFNATPICFTMISCFAHIFCIVVKVDLHILQYCDIIVRIQMTQLYNCTEDYFLRKWYSHSSFHEMLYLYETPDLLAVFAIGQHGHPVLNHWNP